jgi:hypothetical protein
VTPQSTRNPCRSRLRSLQLHLAGLDGTKGTMPSEREAQFLRLWDGGHPFGRVRYLRNSHRDSMDSGYGGVGGAPCFGIGLL